MPPPQKTSEHSFSQEDNERRQAVAFLADHDVSCPFCGQNLRGIVDPSCPECGKPFVFRLGRGPVKAVIAPRALRMLVRWLLLTTLGLIAVAIVTLTSDVNSWFWGAIGVASVPTVWLMIEVLISILGGPDGDGGTGTGEPVELWLNQEPLHVRKVVVEPTGVWRILYRFTILESAGFVLLLAMSIFRDHIDRIEAIKQARLPLTIVLVLVPLIYAIIAAFMLTRATLARKIGTRAP